MKKSIFPRLLVGLLVVTLFTGCLFAGNTTLAMYAATVTGDSTAAVAKFDVTVTGKQLLAGMTGTGVLQAADLDLLTFITELNAGAASGTLQAGNAMDAEVVNDGTKNTKIAPGTDGALPFAITNNSDVAIQFTFTIKAKEAIAATTHPTLTFGSTTGTLDAASTTAYGAVTKTVSGNSAFAADAVIATITGKLTMGGSYSADLTWEWPFLDASAAAVGNVPATAAIDTPIGILAISGLTYPVTVELAVVQID